MLFQMNHDQMPPAPLPWTISGGWLSLIQSKAVELLAIRNWDGACHLPIKLCPLGKVIALLDR